jgi:hypothetical protein
MHLTSSRQNIITITAFHILVCKFHVRVSPEPVLIDGFISWLLCSLIFGVNFVFGVLCCFIPIGILALHFLLLRLNKYHRQAVTWRTEVYLVHSSGGWQSKSMVQLLLCIGWDPCAASWHGEGITCRDSVGHFGTCLGANMGPILMTSSVPNEFQSSYLQMPLTMNLGIKFPA